MRFAKKKSKAKFPCQVTIMLSKGQMAFIDQLCHMKEASRSEVIRGFLPENR